MLNRQLGMMGLDSETDEVIARQIIGSIDEDGYLRRRNAIIDDIMFSQGMEVSKEDVYRILGLVQRFDPPGVGARDLRECLILQLQDKMDKSGDHSRPRTLAMKILVDYFEEFTKNTIKNLSEHTIYRIPN